MAKSNQEAFQTIGRIINRSEKGLFLVIAEEEEQQEIKNIYRGSRIGIYDYRQRGESHFSFERFRDWLRNFPESETIMILNLQLAMQEERDIQSLNFSRDMLADLDKNLIFVITRRGDDMLAREAFDFYSFLKLRVYFTDEQEWKGLSEKAGLDIDGDGFVLQGAENEGIDKGEVAEASGEKKKQLLEEAEKEVYQAEDCREQGAFEQAEISYRKALEIREKVLGEGHLDTASLYNSLGEVYIEEGKYADAEELLHKALKIRREVLGEKHPETAVSYNNLAGVYQEEGRYREAEELFCRALTIHEKARGEKHPDTATSYNNLARVYINEERYKEAKELYQKALEIRESITEDKEDS